MINDVSKLYEYIYSCPLTEGENRTRLPYLSIYFSAQRKVNMPQTDNFYIYTVLDGSIAMSEAPAAE